MDGLEIYRIGLGRYALDQGNCFLIDSDKKALIETGTSIVVDEIIDDLDGLGVNNLDYIAVTHIHMDHAGGAGFLIDQYPEAEVIVHESGIDYLEKTEDLKRSVERATGDFFKYWGNIKPISKDRMISVSGGERFDLGRGYSLKVVQTPGHAPHHVCYYECGSKSLAVGDSTGIYFPNEDELIPSTPPPNFNLEKEMEALRNLKDFDLNRLLFTHEGWSNEPKKVLDRYMEKIKNWVSEIKALKSEFGEEEVLNRIKERYISKWSELFGRKDFARQSLEMNTKGVLIYLNRSSK